MREQETAGCWLLRAPSSWGLWFCIFVFELEVARVQPWQGDRSRRCFARALSIRCTSPTVSGCECYFDSGFYTDSAADADNVTLFYCDPDGVVTDETGAEMQGAHSPLSSSEFRLAWSSCVVWAAAEPAFAQQPAHVHPLTVSGGCRGLGRLSAHSDRHHRLQGWCGVA